MDLANVSDIVLRNGLAGKRRPKTDNSGEQTVFAITTSGGKTHLFEAHDGENALEWASAFRYVCGLST